MDRRIIIRHVSGSKAGEVQEFPLKHFSELVVGREPACAIRFDPNQDDLVSRRHARIFLDKDNPGLFLLADFGSTNGTFLNNRRISGATALSAGDEIRFGANGPSLRFDLYPPPVADSGATRADSEATVQSTGPKPTRESSYSPPPESRSGRSIGGRTLEFTLGKMKGDLLKTLINGGAVLVGILILVGGYFTYRHWDTAQALRRVGDEVSRTQQGMAETGAEVRELTAVKSAAEIFEEFAPTTVLIETSWKLVSAGANKDVCHRHVTLRGKRYALYVDLGNGVIEPYLEPGFCGDDETIGNIGAGTGFVVHPGGYILTNSHVASPWLIPYELNAKEHALLCPLSNSAAKCREMDARLIPTDWVPEKSTQLGGKRIDWKLLRGLYNYLYVTFPATDIRLEASLVNSSEVADVAQIKVNLPQDLKTVNLSTDEASVKAGNPVIVLGYPSVSPEVYERRISQNPTKSGEVFSKVPNPTVTDGSISNVIPGVSPVRGKPERELMSSFGDTYQLTINSTGHGNSGGPVFDSRGEVIGIFTYGMQGGGAAVTKAVPIKYGRDLMNIFH